MIYRLILQDNHETMSTTLSFCLFEPFHCIPCKQILLLANQNVLHIKLATSLKCIIKKKH